MQQAIVRRTLPLPSFLRRVLVERLATAALDDDFALATLKRYDEEVTDDIKTLASIGYHEALVFRKDDLLESTSVLTKTLAAVGPDYPRRIRAALAGLLALGRLDVAAAALDFKGEKPAQWELADAYEPNYIAIRYFVRNWPKVSTAFGDGAWDRFQDYRGGLLEQLTEESTDPLVLEELLRRSMGPNRDSSTGPARLRLLAKLRPKSEELRRVCLETIDIGASDWYGAVCITIAAEILAEQFGGDAATELVLEQALAAHGGRSGVIIALCLGWPGSLVLDDPILTSPYPDLPQLIPARAFLLCRNTSASEFLEKAREIVEDLDGGIWDFLPLTLRAFRQRFTADAALRRLAFERLTSGMAGPLGLIFLPQMIGLQSDLGESLSRWCEEEIGRQVTGPKLPEVTLDLFNGADRSVAHVLSDFLNSTV